MLHKQLSKIKSKVRPAVLIALLVGLCTCSDPVLNFNTFNKEVGVGGNIEMPIGHSRITMKQLLEQLDTKAYNVQVGENADGLITLRFDSLVEYNVSELSDGIDNLVASMFKFNYATSGKALEDVFDIFEGKDYYDLLPEVEISDSMNVDFDFDDLNSDRTKQDIRQIKFNKVTLKFKVSDASTVYPAGVMSADVQIPGTNEFVTLNIDENLQQNGQLVSFTDLTIDVGGNASTTFKVYAKADGETEGYHFVKNSLIEIEAAVDTAQDFDFEVRGFFYYVDKKEFMDKPYEVNMSDYFPAGTHFGLKDPTITFHINHNLGVPFTFKVDSLKPTLAGGSAQVPKLKLYPENLNRVYRPDEFWQDEVVINRHDVDTTGGSDISHLFNSALQTISASYYFQPTYTHYDSLPNKEMQFITKNSHVYLTMSAEFSLWLADSSVIVPFADTIDFDFTDKYSLSGWIDLVLKYKNAFAFGGTIEVSLLDSAGRPIAGVDADKFKFKDVLVAGGIDAPTEGEFTMRFDENMVDELMQAKKILLTVTVLRQDMKEIKVTKSDYIDMTVGVRGNASGVFGKPVEKEPTSEF